MSLIAWRRSSSRSRPKQAETALSTWKGSICPATSHPMAPSHPSPPERHEAPPKPERTSSTASSLQTLPTAAMPWRHGSSGVPAHPKPTGSSPRLFLPCLSLPRHAVIAFISRCLLPPACWRAMTVPSDSTQGVPEPVLPSGATPSCQSSSSRLRSSASHARPAPAHAPHGRIPRDGGRARACGGIRCMPAGCLRGEPGELRLQPRRDPCRGREPHGGVGRGIHAACTARAAPAPEAGIAEPRRDHAGADAVDMHPFRQAGAELPVHLLEGLRMGSGRRLHDRGQHIPLHLPGGIPVLRMGSEASRRIEHDRADGSCQPLQ